MSRADSDLPWFFGSAPQSWAGDAGLRSALGGQLEAVRSEKLASGTVNASQIEDDVHRRLGAATRARAIEARLAQLSDVQVATLRWHYGEGSLPYGVDRSACLLGRVRRLCSAGGVVPQEVLRAALLEASTEEREAIAAEADRLVVGAREAYDALPAQRLRWIQVDDPRSGTHG